jgi:hypothetical protein
MTYHTYNPWVVAVAPTAHPGETPRAVRRSNGLRSAIARRCRMLLKRISLRRHDVE